MEYWVRYYDALGMSFEEQNDRASQVREMIADGNGRMPYIEGHRHGLIIHIDEIIPSEILDRLKDDEMFESIRLMP